MPRGRGGSGVCVTTMRCCAGYRNLANIRGWIRHSVCILDVNGAPSARKPRFQWFDGAPVITVEETAEHYVDVLGVVSQRQPENVVPVSPVPEFAAVRSRVGCFVTSSCRQRASRTARLSALGISSTKRPVMSQRAWSTSAEPCTRKRSRCSSVALRAGACLARQGAIDPVSRGIKP